MKENFLSNQLEESKGNFHKLEQEIVALRANLSKVEIKACLNQKFVKGFETLQNILNMKKSLEHKNGLEFKSSLQNVKDHPSTSYAYVLKGK